MHLAPALVEVEQQVRLRLDGDGGSSNPAALLAVFARARDFLGLSDGLFAEVRETLLTDESGEQKLLLADQERQHTRVCLDKLELACTSGHPMLLGDRLKAFLASAEGCLALFSELAALAGQQPIYSPSPPFDAFIKAAIRLLEGRLDKPVLVARFDALGRELGRLRRLVTLLPRLHSLGESEVSTLKGALSRLECGFGAVETWRRNDDKVALCDGLTLLGSSTTLLTERLRAADEIAAARPQFSTFRPLEEWLRTRQLALHENVPAAWLEASVIDLFRAWDYLLTRATELAENPLSNTGLASTLGPHRAVRQRMHEGLSAAPPPDWLSLPLQHWLELKPTLETLQGEILAAHQVTEERVAPFQELPGLETLATLKEQVRRGQAQPNLLQVELERQLEQVEELIDSVAEARDPISGEFRELLPVHRAAFLGMLENLEQRDWVGLEALWQSVMTTLPHLIALSKGIARRLASQGSASRRIACLHCTHSNGPERRICAGCGANLPAVVQRVQSVAELGHARRPSEEPPMVSPDAVEILEEMVRGVESNRITRRQTGEIIQALLADIDKVRKTFGAKILPLIGQDGTLDIYLRFFAQAMGVYTGSLKGMLEFSEGASLAKLHSGLAECRDTLAILEELKFRIDEALRG